MSRLFLFPPSTINYTQMTPAQVEQEVGSRIQTNANTNAKGVDMAVIDSMATLDNIETRVKTQSRNVSHEGIGIDAIHDMYMDYLQNKVALADIAFPMAGAIKMVMSAQTLTASENVRLTNALAGIIGDVNLAEAYVDGTVDEEVESGYNNDEHETSVNGEEIAQNTSIAPLTGKKIIVDAHKQNENVKYARKRLLDIRNQMPNSDLRNRGNMAIADVNIKGIDSLFLAHSKIHNSKSNGANLANFSYAPEKRVFKTYVIDGFPRFNDTEAKILENIAIQIKDKYESGTINLYTELPACQSCSNIILEFRRMFPNIQLNVYSILEVYNG